MYLGKKNRNHHFIMSAFPQVYRLVIFNVHLGSEVDVDYH